MYKGLYDIRKGLSDHDREQIGIMMARLLLPWNRWVHRRVERLAFCDEDAVRRETSIDFTLPYWYHEIRKTPHFESKRQLVPLAFLRKGALVNFSLRNEQDTSIPMLTTAQNAQVAEALLSTLGAVVLGQDMPDTITCDIRNLVRELPPQALESYRRIIKNDGPSGAARAKLGADATFTATATAFIRSFLALTVLDIRRHERRIVRLSYEESFWDNSSGNRKQRLTRLSSIAIGTPRIMLVASPTVGDAASSHIELEAPDGLQISTREQYVRVPSGISPKPATKVGGFGRAHVHFSDAEPGSEAMVVAQLLPRRSTIIRSAVGTCALVAIALVLITLRVAQVRHDIDGGDVAATLLLSSIGLLGLFLVRSGESPMSSTLLFPVRLLAISPIVWSFIAALILVGDFNETLTRWLLIGTCILTLISGLRLAQTWYRVVTAAAR